MGSQLFNQGPSQAFKETAPSHNRGATREVPQSYYFKHDHCVSGTDKAHKLKFLFESIIIGIIYY